MPEPATPTGASTPSWAAPGQALRLRALLAVSRDVVLIVRHADHRIVAASPSAERCYGSSETALCQLCYDDLVTDRKAVADIFAQHRTSVPLRYHRRADGTRFPVEMAIHWLHDTEADGDGSELGIFRITDQTPAVQEERRVRGTESSHQAIFRTAPFPILVLDRRGMVSDANDAALALYRHTPATLIGLPMASLLQDPALARQFFRNARWNDSGQWHLHSDGEPFQADVFVSIVRLSTEVHAIVVVRDVTAEQAMLERLRASEARWRFALEGHGDAMWEWDLASRHFQVSRSFSEQLGDPPLGLQDAASYWRELVHPGDRPSLYRALVAHLKGETPLLDVEVRLRTRQAGERWVWLRGRVLERDESGRALRLLGSVRDVHAQKQQAQELAHWREQVQHTARVTSMGEMAAVLAHELNQPLTSLRTFAAAALHRLDNEALRDPAELRRAVQLMADESLRAGRIVSHIRSFVRKGPARVEPVAVNELVSSVQRLADIQAQRLEAEVTLALSTGLPRVKVDRVLAEQLLLNLVRNGLEAMRQTQPGQRRVEISARVGPPGQVEICVRDHGCGLPEGLDHDIYNPFVSTKTDGLGMGLAICRSIVESHHGQLWAEPNPGGGAAFHLTLPTEESAAHAAQATPVRRRSRNPKPTRASAPRLRG